MDKIIPNNRQAAPRNNTVSCTVRPVTWTSLSHQHHVVTSRCDTSTIEKRRQEINQILKQPSHVSRMALISTTNSSRITH